MSRIPEPSTIVITGASRGIGRQIARAFASESAHHLLLVARSGEGLEETRRLCMDAEERGGQRFAAAPCDLTDPEAVQRLKLPKGWPRVGMVINNAGSYLLKSLSSTSYEEYQKQIQANLFSAVHTTNRFLEDLRPGGGLIVNVCSVGALLGLPESGAYSSSKHALLGYTRSLREELKKQGIGVTAVNLGQTSSPSWEQSHLERERLVDPDDVATLMVALSKLSPRTVVEEMKIQPQGGSVDPI